MSSEEEQRLEFVRRIGLFRLEITEIIADAYRLAQKLVPSHSRIFLSLVDSNKQKILMGPDSEGPLVTGSLLDMDQETNLCYHTVQGRRTLDVPDTRQDKRFVGSASVQAGLVRAYCGIPMFAEERGSKEADRLVSGHEGFPIGAFCVYSGVPQDKPLIDSRTHEILSNLARLVSREIEIQGHRWRESREEELQQIAADAAAWAAQRPLVSRADDTVFRQLSWAICEALDCTTCCLLAPDEESCAVTVLAASGDEMVRQEMLDALQTASFAQRSAWIAELGIEGARSCLTRQEIDSSVHAAFASPSAESLYCLPLYSTDGRLELVVQVTRSALLSGFYRAEIALIGTIARAAHTELARQRILQPEVTQTAFAERIAHGLRTPLHILRNDIAFVAEACQANDLSKVKSHLAGIEASVGALERALKGIGDLQDLASPSSSRQASYGAPSMPRSESNSSDTTSEASLLQCVISDVVKKAVEHAIQQHGQISDNDVRVELHLLEGAAEPSVTGDQVDLQAMTFQLVCNAVKFTNSGNIVITIKAVDDCCELCVNDTGCGMSEAYQRGRMFRPFDQAATVVTEGLGLGLSLTKMLVERCRGTLDITSVLGQGTRARVTLPIVSPSPSQSSGVTQRLLVTRDTQASVLFTPIIEGETLTAQQTNGRSRAGSVSSTKGPRESESSFRLLLVDDNIIARRVLCMIVKRMGLSYVEAVDGIDAVRQFKLTRPHCVVTDQSMPNINGVQAAALMRAHEEAQGWPRSHIMVLSALDPPPSIGTADEWQIKGSMGPAAMRSRVFVGDTTFFGSQGQNMSMCQWACLCRGRFQFNEVVDAKAITM